MPDTTKIYSVCYTLKINSNMEIMSPSLGFQERNNKSSVETNMFFCHTYFYSKVLCLLFDKFWSSVWQIDQIEFLFIKFFLLLSMNRMNGTSNTLINFLNSLNLKKKWLICNTGWHDKHTNLYLCDWST